MNVLADNLKKLRLEKNLRQYQVADIVGVNPSAISAYENGLRQPSYEVLIRLADLYRVSIDFILGRSDNVFLNISGLSEREAYVISKIVAELSERN